MLLFPRKTPASSVRSGPTSLHAAAINLLASLPSCTAANVPKVAMIAGSTGLFSQVALTKLLQRNDRLKENAGYTAHTVVAMALMVLVSYIGVAGWWLSGPLPAAAAARLTVEFGSARWLAAVTTGMFVFWDVPVSCYVKQLRKPDVVFHHIVMAVVACVVATSLPTLYAFFYLGISELSSIALLIYDQLSVLTNNGKDKSNKRLLQLRQQFQAVAAVCFTFIRAFLFTKVTVFDFVPDVLSVLPTANTLIAPLRFFLVSVIGFTALQLFWFSKMLRVIFGADKEADVHTDTL